VRYLVTMKWHFIVSGEYMPNENIAVQSVESLTEPYMKQMLDTLAKNDGKMFSIVFYDEEMEVQGRDEARR